MSITYVQVNSKCYHSLVCTVRVLQKWQGYIGKPLSKITRRMYKYHLQCMPIIFMTHRSLSGILSPHGEHSQVRVNFHRSWPTDRCNRHRLHSQCYMNNTVIGTCMQVPKRRDQVTGGVRVPCAVLACHIRCRCSMKHSHNSIKGQAL